MKQQKIRLQQLRAIARYETTFKDILDAQGPSGDGNGVHILGRYFYTLDDLLAALKNIRDKDPKAADFQTYWITPIRDGATHFSRNCLAIPADDPDAKISDTGAMPKIDAAIAEIEAFLDQA